MSNPLFKLSYEGALAASNAARGAIQGAIDQFGADCPVGYPETAYRLPSIFALTGNDVKTLGDLLPILDTVGGLFLKEGDTLESAMHNGVVTVYAAEMIEALGYLNGAMPFAGTPYTGFIPDSVLRSAGIALVDGTIPGVAVLVGQARTGAEAAALVRDLQSKGLLILLVDGIIEQLAQENVKVGPEYLTVPLGHFTQIVHAANFAFRAGLAFGNVKPGDLAGHVAYQQKRVPAFVLALGEQDAIRISAAFACTCLGYPVLTDVELGELQIPDLFVTETDYHKMVVKALEMRSIKIKILDIDVPVTIGPAFEGETIRKADTFVEMGGGRSEAFELVQMVDEGAIEDGRITVVGPELDGFQEGDKVPFGLVVKIYGRKMQEDFEGVLERRIHYFVNYGEGLWHVAQRDINWMRISKEAVAKGFRFEHLGRILIAKFKNEFPSIVDRVEVVLYTDPSEVSAQHEKAKAVYAKRDARMRTLTDENVEALYSCTLCQSFAPNHCCVVSPERVGLCGAVSWLDAKASHEITPTGPNQPIPKDGELDAASGRWEAVNDFIKRATNGSVEEVALYSFMQMPMTSCGCFEAILAIVPEANGLMVTTREHTGQTPCGMSFSTLAGTVGGGVQSPGFMGVGRSYLNSKKFIKADGGLARVIWMPKSLKDFLGDDFKARCVEEGLGEGFVDQIADETIGTTVEEILPFLEEKKHPALAMEALL